MSPTGGSGPVQSGGSGGASIAAGDTVAAGNGGSSNTGNPTTSFGATLATGGSSSGNTGVTATGGAATGGKSATGGTATGGKSATGGTATGGKSATGGAATGGVASGGAATAGGAATGGTSTASTSDPCSGAASLSGGTKHCNANNSGSYGSYQWQLWSTQTTGCLTTYGNAGAAFSASWDNSGDFMARVGLTFDDTKTYQELGTFSADFAETKTGTAGTYSYVGAYGRTVQPNVEFYIVEDSFNSPPSSPGGDKLGVVEVDGGSYDVYQHPVTSTTGMVQFFSIRQMRRQCGHISITEHFSKWANLGMQLGAMHEVSILVEAAGGSGSLDFTTASVVVN